MKNLYVAIGDIHGHLAPALTALELLAKSPATVVFLGDYIDRGPQGPHVIEALHQASLIFDDWQFLAGNHEKGFLQDLLKVHGHRSPASLAEDCISQYGGRASIPREHVDFLSSLPLYLETDHLVFVHGGVTRHYSHPSEVSEYELTWTYEISGSIANKKIVRGHRYVPTPNENKMAISLDTGVWRPGGTLTLGVIIDRPEEPNLIGYASIDGKGLLQGFTVLDESAEAEVRLALGFAQNLFHG